MNAMFLKRGRDKGKDQKQHDFNMNFLDQFFDVCFHLLSCYQVQDL